MPRERKAPALQPLPTQQPRPARPPSPASTEDDDRYSERSLASSALIYPITELAPRPPPQQRSKHHYPSLIQQQLYQQHHLNSSHLSPQDARHSRVFTQPATATTTTASGSSGGSVPQRVAQTPVKRSATVSSSPRGREIVASSSSRQSKTASPSSGGGRFEFASDKSPLQKLEQELKNIGNDDGQEQKPGIVRSLSKRETERLKRTTTVTSAVTGHRSPLHREYTEAPKPVESAYRNNVVHESMAETRKSKGRASASKAPASSSKKHGGSWMGYIRGTRASSSSSSISSTDSGKNAARGKSSQRDSREQVAHLTIEDGELRDDATDEILTADPEPDYGQPYNDEGKPFTLSDTLSSGLIILPTSPDTPFFHMVRNPLLQQPKVPHPYRPSEDVEALYPKPRKLSTATAASYSSPDLHENLAGSEPVDPQPFQSTSTLMQYLNAIPQRPVPEPSIFTPRLYVKCGPLLRYVGLRHDGIKPRRGPLPTSKEERVVWRGSVMIVTADDRSSYTSPPRLRLFVQPIELLEDRVESSGRRGSVASVWRKRDGEKQKKFQEVVGTKLLAERGVTWWRFTLEVELNDKQARIAYRINHGPTIAFWVPARGETMNMMFHSCNGFSLGINPADFSGPDPMWRDVLKSHRRRPFHLMIGGGDQVYNDAVAEQTKLFREWLSTKNIIHKYTAEWTPEMAEELEKFYLERYCDWFSQGLFGVANSQIPMVNMWDDHDIIDGFGSYPSIFNGCPVFSGLGGIAHKHYLLFQHQTRVHEYEDKEPSWIMGNKPGPYITERSRSLFMQVGRKVALLGIDCRTERQRDVIVSPETYTIIFDRARREVVKGETKHLIVLLGVPIAYPRLVWLETLLTSKFMDPLKALARMNILGGLLNSFDGGVEILDDLDDHWTAKNHKSERNAFIKDLQLLAAEKSVRITILGGDVHLSGIGQFFSNPQLGLSKERDHRYMPNVISSAIVNAPPPNTMADVLNKRNKVHHLDPYTDEDMHPMFPMDVDGKPRNNKRLMPRRNYCTLNEYDPNRTEELPELNKTTSRIGSIPRFLMGGKKEKKRKDKQEGPPPSSGQGRSGIPDILLMNSDALEVTIRVEVNQRRSDGDTKPYRLLVPTLQTPGYEGMATPASART